MHRCKSKLREQYGDSAPKTHYEYSTADKVKWGDRAPKKHCGYCGERL